jgi:hypothetical protein
MTLCSLAEIIQEVAKRAEEKPARRGHAFWIRRAVIAPFHLLDRRPRFLMGSVLLAAWLIWAYQNGLDLGTVGKILLEPGWRATRPLQCPGLPTTISQLFDGLGLGIAGLILLISSPFRGILTGLFAATGAVMAWQGPSLGMPPYRSLGPTELSMAAGVGIGLLGMVLGRWRQRKSRPVQVPPLPHGS